MAGTDPKMSFRWGSIYTSPNLGIALTTLKPTQPASSNLMQSLTLSLLDLKFCSLLPCRLTWNPQTTGLVFGKWQFAGVSTVGAPKSNPSSLLDDAPQLSSWAQTCHAGCDRASVKLKSRNVGTIGPWVSDLGGAFVVE